MTPHIRARCLGLLLLGVLIGSLPTLARAGSETPPEGPPWVRALAAAQTEAIKRGVPIFVYLTKTYCPHCVKLEKEVLGQQGIAPIYDKAVWLYVFRDFSKSEDDRAAERVALRLGFSSYPQHHLLHPVTLERLATPARTIEGFLQTFGNVDVGEIGTVEAPGALAAAEARAAKLETKRSTKDAVRALDEEADIVVRFRALEVLAEKKPIEVVKRADTLMAVPNDLLRYEVCKALQAHGDAASAPVLEATVKTPANSLNPNVLRIRAVQALAACGTADSIAVIAPFARGPWNNGLTRISILAIGQIAERDKPARSAAKEALVAAYPAPSKPEDSARVKRAVLSIAETVHESLRKLTRKAHPFPATYDEATVAKLRALW